MLDLILNGGNMEENQQPQNNEDTVVIEKVFKKMKDTIGEQAVQIMELQTRLQMKTDELNQYKLEQDLLAHQEELKKGLDHE